MGSGLFGGIEKCFTWLGRWMRMKWRGEVRVMLFEGERWGEGVVE